MSEIQRTQGSSGKSEGRMHSEKSLGLYSRLSEVSVLYQFRPPLSVHIENRERWRVYERTVYRPPENSKSLSWSSV